MIEIAFFFSLDATPPQAHVRAPQPMPLRSLQHLQYPGSPKSQGQHGQVQRPSRLRAPVRCDDGSKLREPDGSPNWACELRDCSPHEAICWSDRLDFCFTEDGDDAGVCAWGEPQSCDSRWSCFDTWSGCNGQWECHENVSWVGCTDGTCTPRPKFATASPPQVFAECTLETGSDPNMSMAGNVAAIARGLFAADAAGTFGGHGDV